eukprot:scaffold24373_cov145-Amphora_coffeaeformis.AAC.1
MRAGQKNPRKHPNCGHLSIEVYGRPPRQRKHPLRRSYSSNIMWKYASRNTRPKSQCLPKLIGVSALSADNDMSLLTDIPSDDDEESSCYQKPRSHHHHHHRDARRSSSPYDYNDDDNRGTRVRSFPVTPTNHNRRSRRSRSKPRCGRPGHTPITLHEGNPFRRSKTSSSTNHDNSNKNNVKQFMRNTSIPKTRRGKFTVKPSREMEMTTRSKEEGEEEEEEIEFSSSYTAEDEDPIQI